jgi:hypothetical protein
LRVTIFSSKAGGYAQILGTRTTCSTVAIIVASPKLKALTKVNMKNKWWQTFFHSTPEAMLKFWARPQHVEQQPSLLPWQNKWWALTM